MPSFTPPVRDTRFVLEHVVGLPRYANMPRFEAATPDVVDAVLEEGGRFVAEVLFPLNQVGDREGCTRHPDGSVTASWSSPAGRRSPTRRSSAGRGCRTCSRPRFRNIWAPPTWPSPCTRG